VGEGTQSARAEVLAARSEVLAARGQLEGELGRLRASARASVDVKAKVRRSPAKFAGAAAGVGFLAVGGPRRVLRRVRAAVFGEPTPLPESMLPEEIDKALRALGDDGGRVRGAIEREFASYLRERTPELRSRDLWGSVARTLTTFGRPIAFRYGVRVASQLLGDDHAQLADRLAKADPRHPSIPRPGLPRKP